MKVQKNLFSEKSCCKNSLKTENYSGKTENYSGKQQESRKSLFWGKFSKQTTCVTVRILLSSEKID